MNDEVQKQLVEWFQDAAEKGGAFVERELPLFAEEVVAWHFWSSLWCAVVCACVAAVLGLIGVLCARSLWRAYKADSVACHDWAPPLIIASVICLPASAATLLAGVGINGYECVKASVAPRVVIVEYLRGNSR